jgi:hypothetical protein
MLDPMRRVLVLGLLATSAVGLGGCELAGWAANGVAMAQPPVTVKAEYHGLDNKIVAVLVDADQAVLFEHPLAQYEVSAAVSARLAENIPGVKVIDAKQVVDFQQRNIYWNTSKLADVAAKLGANRLVVIDLIDYRWHEPGNINIWRGMVSASVNVVESDGPKPNDPAYSTTLTAAYPPKKPEGIINGDVKTIRFGTLDLFSRGVANKFHDHSEDRAAK